MANLNTSLFKLDALESLTPKVAYFNNYMQEFAQVTYKSSGPASLASIAGSGGAGIATTIAGKLDIDLPLSLKLIMFTAKHIEGVPFLPGIILPINPDQFKAQFKKRSDVIYTLGGFVINHWHDDVITITASGMIPSFGSRAKILTTSYQVFLQLLNLYKSCGQIATSYSSLIEVPSLDRSKLLERTGTGRGVVFDESLNDVSIPRKDTMVISGTQLRNATIELVYQHDLYEGIFIDFNIEESYDMPNTLRYTFTFKAISHKNIITDKLSGGNAMTAGDTISDSVDTTQSLSVPGNSRRSSDVGLSRHG